MKKQLLATSLALTVLMSTGAAVSADKGGHPNENACHGEVVSGLAREGNPPGHRYGNAGDFNKMAKTILCVTVIVS